MSTDVRYSQGLSATRGEVDSAVMEVGATAWDLLDMAAAVTGKSRTHARASLTLFSVFQWMGRWERYNHRE